MSCYRVRVSGLKDGAHINTFEINNQFFELFVNNEAFNFTGKAEVTVFVKSFNTEIKIKTLGILNTKCDICASKIEAPISNSHTFLIKESPSPQPSTDEIIYINKGQFFINSSQYIYESIVLSIPTNINHNMKGIKDKCDKEMIQLINKYSKPVITTDPRWDKLKKIKDIK